MDVVNSKLDKKIKGGSTLGKISQKEMAKISIIFKNSVNKKGALKIISQLGLSQFQRKRTDGRKNGLIVYSVSVPSAKAEKLAERIDQEEGVVKARIASSKS